MKEKEIFIENRQSLFCYYLPTDKISNFYWSKLCIVVEEADESVFWMEVIKDATLSNDNLELERLLKESIEITKIMTKAKSSTFLNKH